MRRFLHSFPLWGAGALGLILVPLVTLEELDPRTRLVGYAWASITLAVIAVLTMRGGERLSIAPITAVIAVLVFYAFLLVPWTPLPVYMIERPMNWVLGLAVLLAVQASLHKGAPAATWENALLAAGTLISLMSCLLVVVWFVEWGSAVGTSAPPLGFRLPGVFVAHPNIIAGYLNLLLPLTLVRIVASRRWSGRIFLTLMFASFLVTEYFTSSRGGWLGGAAGLLVTAGLLTLPWVRRTFGTVWQRNRSRTVAVVATLVVALGIAAWGAYAVLARQASRTYHAPVASARSDIWVPALAIIRDSPIIGQGPGAFVVRFAQATQIPPGFSTNHAHNLALQLAAEMGVLGLLVALAAAGIGLWSLGPAIRRSLSTTDPALAAYLGGFTALLVHHAFDYLFNVTAYLMAVMVLTGLASMHALSRRKLMIPGRAVGGFLLIATSIVLALAAWATRGETPYLRGLQASRQGDSANASESICLAAGEAPDISLFGFQCALAMARQAAQADDVALVEVAAQVERLAIAGDPYWPMHQANLAGLEWVAGDHEQAAADMQAAVLRAPRHSLLAVNLGWMYEQQGREDEALEAYRQALAYDLLLPETPFMAASPIRRRALSTYVYALPISDSDQLVADARRSIALGRMQEALTLLDRAVEANPRSARAFAWRARTLLDLGRADDAWRELQIALFVQFNSPEALALGAAIASQTGHIEEASRYGRNLHEALETTMVSAGYYAELYRRPYLSFDMVPQLIRAVPTREMISALELAAVSYTARGEAEKARAARALMLAD